MMEGSGPILTATVALVGVLVLVAIAARVARIGGWAPRPRAGKLLALLESVALDGRRRLHVVRCGEQQVVLLTGGTQDVVVGWLHRVDEPGLGDPRLGALGLGEPGPGAMAPGNAGPRSAGT